jgi:electron transport complex protein RnfB
MSTQARQGIDVDQIDAWLPQTQCTQCGYPRCRAYAEAVAHGEAGINQCPPGGDVTIAALAKLLNTSPEPLDPRFGIHKPRARAVIDEAVCIGCRKCIDACPVDAIVGARKLMHTVIASECTGCELCLPPCPVDCIAMVPDLTGHARSASGSPPSPACGRRDGGVADVRWTSAPLSGRASCSRTPAGINEGEGAHSAEPWPEYTRAETNRWRARTENRLRRLARRKRTRHGTPRSTESAAPLPHDRERIRAEIRAAVERVKAKKKRQSNRDF